MAVSRQPEVRQGSYTDAAVALLVQAAGGAAAGDPNATGALEACAGLYARSFAAATVEPEMPTLTPSVMAMIARALIRRGEIVYEIDVVDGQPVLRAIGDFDVRGGADPASWAYRAVRHGPSRTETTLLSAAEVLHFRYATEPSRPWRGISPLGWAHRLGDLIGNAETRLSQEASGTVGRVLPMPVAGGDGTDADPTRCSRPIWRRHPAGFILLKPRPQVLARAGSRHLVKIGRRSASDRCRMANLPSSGNLRECRFVLHVASHRRCCSRFPTARWREKVTGPSSTARSARWRA